MGFRVWQCLPLYANVFVCLCLCMYVSVWEGAFSRACNRFSVGSRTPKMFRWTALFFGKL